MTSPYLTNPPLTSREKRLVGVLRDLTALYEASPGRDPGFVAKARAILAEIDGKESSQ